MIYRFLRAFAALVTLVVIAVGVPVALTMWGHWPIDGVPTWEQVRTLPDTIVSDTAVFGLLTLAAWAIWALFMCSVVFEIGAEISGNDAPRLRLAGPLQTNARRLVAAILMTVSVLGPLARGVGAQPLGAPDAIAPQPAPSPSRPATPTAHIPDPLPTETSHPPVTPYPQVEVMRGDNPWDLATKHLGDPMRWREIWDLNRGAPQADGRAWTVPDVIEPGWRLRLPADAHVPNDIPTAEAEYMVRPGDTLSEIARDHLGSVERYPEIFDRNVGRLQADGEALQDPDLVQPGWILDLPSAAAAEPMPEEPPPRVPEEPNASIPQSVPSVPATTTTTPISDAASGSVTSPEATLDDESTSSPGSLAPVGLVGGGIATAGVLLVLERRRRAQMRRRGRGQIPPIAEGSVSDTEMALRAGADPLAATRLDDIARAASRVDLPRLHHVETREGDVRLVFDAPAGAPPAGFEAVTPGEWRATGPASALDCTAGSPTPLMVPIGIDPTGAEVLIDLELPPVTTVLGDATAGCRLLQTMAMALATEPWSEHVRLLIVGQELAAIDTVERADSLDGALDELEARASAVAERLATAGCSLTAARASGVTPDLWVPLAVLCPIQPTQQQLERIRRLNSADPRSIALVIPSTANAVVGRVLAVDGDGHALLDDALEVEAHLIPDGQVQGVAQLLREAENECVDRSDCSTDRPVAMPCENPGPGRGALPSLLRGVDAIVHVLGEVRLTRLVDGVETPIAVSKQKSLEAISYLALRETSVDRDALQAALWPSGANSTKTFHNTIWAARKALDRGGDGRDLLPEPVDARYELSATVVSDYGLFHELAARAEHVEDPSQAAEFLMAALELVRGEPFVGVGRAYAWVAPHAGLIVAQVLDAAEELAEIRLAAEDWHGAEWAARQGLRILPCDERMYRILMRAAHCAGSVAGVRRAFAELLDAIADPDDGVEPEDTIHPETVALLEQLTRMRSATA